MKINLNVKKSQIHNASSKVKIAYKNLELYDKGEYRPSAESYKRIVGEEDNAGNNK